MTEPFRGFLVCDEDNLASEKVIQKNGGVFENRLFDSDESVFVKRYWIQIGKPRRSGAFLRQKPAKTKIDTRRETKGTSVPQTSSEKVCRLRVNDAQNIGARRARPAVNHGLTA